MSFNTFNPEPGNQCEGFKLIKKTFIAEMNSSAYEFIHEKSGAKLLYIDNNDDNKVFSISFRTTPTDDTGVAHIVEHSVLCGSRKFPAKEPFVELVKGSLNTFLNAMTFPDKTMYPIASRNDKDFRNLMDVYLDAVFYPKMISTPEVLMQEGWHYEIQDKNDPLVYSGVVYNEMKGALSSPDSILERKILNNLYPDTTYQYESGGDPKAIPELTQEKFIDFHSRYYHPANSYIYLYGNMDIKATLKFINDEYLSNFDKIEIDSTVTRQVPFAQRKHLIEDYPIAPGESKEHKTFLSLNYAISEATDIETALAFTILENALLKSEAAPLRNALIEAQLGADINSSYDNGILQPMFSIIVNGSEAEELSRFTDVVDTTLRKLVREGIDKDLLRASINSIEFKLREADFGQYPKGLIYNINLMNTWLYDGDAVASLQYEDVLERVKAYLDSGKFEALITKYLLDNPHSHTLVLRPNDTMVADYEASLADKLAQIKASMSEAEIADIIESTKLLKERQRSVDSPEVLATIPLLDIKDIDTKATRYEAVERTIEDVKTLFYPINTNGIAYVDLFFDANTIAVEDVNHLFLLEEILGRTGTTNYSYQEMATAINMYTGGIRANIASFNKATELERYEAKFHFKAKVLQQNMPKLMELLKEIITEAKFTDKQRIKDLLMQCKSDFEMAFLRSGNQLVIDELMSYFNGKDYFDSLGNLPFYAFVKDFLNDFDASFERMQATFIRILPQLFSRHNLIIGITGSEELYADIAPKFETLLSVLSTQQSPEVMVPFTVDKKNEAFTTSSQVQYVFKGANFRRLGYSFKGAMKVLETIMRYDYLWTNIRVLGGAYGAFVKFRYDGNMYFGSYRDPNLAETLRVYDNTAEYLCDFKVSDREMTKYIIGTISAQDTPLTPSLQGGVAISSYFTGINSEVLQQTRDEILSTKQEDIRALASLVNSCMQENAICVLGGTAKVEANRDLFKQVTALL